MFIVLKSFDDLYDKGADGKNCHRYKPGDVYPRQGYKPTSGRVRALLSGENALGIPLICIQGMKPGAVAEERGTVEKSGEKAETKPKNKPAADAAKRKTSPKRAASKKAGAGSRKTAGTARKAETGSRSVKPVSRLNK